MVSLRILAENAICQLAQIGDGDLYLQIKPRLPSGKVVLLSFQQGDFA